MISFTLNNEVINYSDDLSCSLLHLLRHQLKITSVKDGCSSEGTCGACLVQLNNKAALACKVKLSQLQNAEILTIEGIPDATRTIIANSFVEKGAVQCGFCTPALVLRTFILLNEHSNPTINEIKKAINIHLCRCTGYTKIVEAIELAGQRLRGIHIMANESAGRVGDPITKYEAFDAAIGRKKFTDDLFFDPMLFAALKFSDHAKAKILKLNVSNAEKMPGVVKIVTAKDIPGERFNGLIFNDWPLMIDLGETTRYIGDVLAGVVAQTEEQAREAVAAIEIEYEIKEPVTDPILAMNPSEPTVHPGKANLIENCIVKRGNAESGFYESEFVAHGIFSTQRIEHAFLEKESAVAMPQNQGIKIYSQSQGVYEDRRQIARILNLNESDIEVELVSNGGGFGGKEDLSVQGHVSLFAWLLQKTVKLTLSRPESIRMHPKRHPVFMDLTIACDKHGKLIAAKLDAIGDTGAYASVGTKVMERVAGHATGGYYFPHVDLQAKTVYTNNIPSGAMRGFGANQVTFALEVLIDELCEKGGFDRWQFRYDNALVDGLETSTGQKVYGVGIQQCLLALKADYEQNKYTGLACGIKNSGVGNGMVDQSAVIIRIIDENNVIIEHGWTEMGQGVHNMAIQTLVTETEISKQIIQIKVNTNAEIKTGMTTSSRATALLGLAIIDACKTLKTDLLTHSLNQLAGKDYYGEFICDWTNKPGANVANPVIHYSYGYAAQLCILNEQGNIQKIIAAHDGGKIMNPLLFEGQVQGAVHMGTGYAISENLPMKEGQLVHQHLGKCGVLRANEAPETEVKLIEVPDQVGPYGAKGIGEIGLVPTAGAIANAYYQYNQQRQYNLPLKKPVSKKINN